MLASSKNSFRDGPQHTRRCTIFDDWNLAATIMKIASGMLANLYRFRAYKLHFGKRQLHESLGIGSADEAGAMSIARINS